MTRYATGQLGQTDTHIAVSEVIPVAVRIDKHIGNIHVIVDDAVIAASTPEIIQQTHEELRTTIARILSTPENAERLRKLNHERYGDDL